MDRAISRRDFLNGLAGTGAALALGCDPEGDPRGSDRTPGFPFRPDVDARTHPPLRTGMRGSHPGSFEVAHARVAGAGFEPTREADETEYDLVVVGAGVSGLAAAHFFRERNPGARVLVLDNHDDFGGHAKRNEFRVGDRMQDLTGKVAVVGVAEGLRTELEPEGIAVTLLCPGLVDTRIWDGARARPQRFGGPRTLPEEVGERWRSHGMSAEDVGRWGVECLREGRFFALMPDDQERAAFVEHRHREIVDGIRYPGD